jgi:tetratricopeptide (TPR) repeat protein
MVAVFFRPHPSTQELFAENFQPYPNVFEPTVRGTNEATKRSEAFQAYEQGDYKRAVVLFDRLLQEKKEPGILLLNGNANLMLGNVEEAKKNFITLNADFDELDIQSKWFLSLCYLKSGDMEHAKPILEELGNTEISYARKAKELLKEVK